jgi:hypothetical protein
LVSMVQTITDGSMTDMTVYVRRLCANLLYLARPAPPGDKQHGPFRYWALGQAFMAAGVICLLVSSYGPVVLGESRWVNVAGLGAAVFLLAVGSYGSETAELLMRHRSTNTDEGGPA